MKYMKSSIKEIIYNRAESDIKFIENLLIEDNLGDSVVAEQSKKILSDWMKNAKKAKYLLNEHLHYTIQ